MLAVRVSYVGELGWELHHPLELQRSLYDLLHEAGAELGLVDFGYRALESMRFEKCYRLWGADLSADWSPLQAGLERFVAFEKGDFLGRDALLREREEGVSHRLSCLVVDADGADAHGYEPVYVDRGKPVAYVSSGGYGHDGREVDRAGVPPRRPRGRRHRARDRNPRIAAGGRGRRTAVVRPRQRAPSLVAPDPGVLERRRHTDVCSYAAAASIIASSISGFGTLGRKYAFRLWLRPSPSINSASLYVSGPGLITGTGSRS